MWGEFQNISISNFFVLDRFSLANKAIKWFQQHQYYTQKRGINEKEKNSHGRYKTCVQQVISSLSESSLSHLISCFLDILKGFLPLPPKVF